MPTALRTASEVIDHVRRALSEAVDAPRHPWHWPALATALDNRIVVLRAANRDDGTLEWYTDRRSEKMTQLAADPRVALVFYHGDERRQLRLYGRAVEVTDGAQRHERWAGVAPKAKANYLTQHAPGSVIAAPDGDLPLSWMELSPEEDQMAFARFTIMQVAVARADFLQLLPDGSALRCGWRQGDPLGSFCWKAP